MMGAALWSVVVERAKLCRAFVACIMRDEPLHLILLALLCCTIVTKYRLIRR